MNMKSKKMSSLLATALASVTLLAGCGSGQASSTAASTAPSQAATPASSAAASSEASTESTDKKAQYIIACDAKYAPFSMEIDGVYQGIDVELIAAIAEEEGFAYELQPMDFSGIIPALVTGKIDGSIAGMNITEARKESVDFSDGYIQSGSAIVASAQDTSINSLEDLQGKIAAVKKGTTGATFAEENEEKYGLIVNYFDDSPGMFLAVSNGQADFLVEDFPVITYQIKVGEQEKLRVAVPEIAEAPYNGFAVKKGENEELLSMFNEGLKKLKENGKYDEIVGKYIS